MEHSELTSRILGMMLPKSGVREWEDAEACALITQRACEMASAILQYTESGEEPVTMSKETYLAEGTALLINGEVGADYALSMEGVANAAGRVSARIDLGAAPRPYLYRWRCKLACQATPTAGNQVRLYKAESDGTYEDGDVGTADAELVAAQLTNMRQFGAVTVDTADTSDQIAGGVVEIHERHVSIGGWNASGATLNATDSNFVFTLTPIYDQQQA
jgi:hypothetical protein